MGLAGIPLGQLYKRAREVSRAAQVCPPAGRTTVALGTGERPGAHPPPPACFHVQNPMRRSRTCGGPFPAVSPGEGGLQPAGGHSRTKGQCHPVAGLSPLPVTRTGEKGATGRPRHFLRMERRELLPCRLTPQLLRTPQTPAAGLGAPRSARPRCGGSARRPSLAEPGGALPASRPCRSPLPGGRVSSRAVTGQRGS